MHLGAVKPNQNWMHKYHLGRLDKRASLHVKPHRIALFKASWQKYYKLFHKSRLYMKLEYTNKARTLLVSLKNFRWAFTESTNERSGKKWSHPAFLSYLSRKFYLTLFSWDLYMSVPSNLSVSTPRMHLQSGYFLVSFKIANMFWKHLQTSNPLKSRVSSNQRM